MAGQEAQLIDPAEKAGNRERWGQARLRGFWDGDPRPARVLIRPCAPASPLCSRHQPGMCRGSRKPGGKKNPRAVRGMATRSQGIPCLVGVGQVPRRAGLMGSARGGPCSPAGSGDGGLGRVGTLPGLPFRPSPHRLGHLGVQALVGDEVGALLEALVALAAAEGPLARVHAPVVQQVGAQ